MSESDQSQPRLNVHVVSTSHGFIMTSSTLFSSKKLYYFISITKGPRKQNAKLFINIQFVVYMYI